MTQDTPPSSHQRPLVLPSPWIVVRGTPTALMKAEAMLGAASLYIPRITVYRRPSGRSRRTEPRTVTQFPGYAFATSLALVESVAERTGIRAIFDSLGHPYTVTVAEVTQAYTTETDSAAPPAPPESTRQPKIGDAVSVSVGRHGILSGRIIRIDGRIVRITSPGWCLPVHIDVSRLRYT